MEKAYNSAQLTEIVEELGFLPLLDSGIKGYSAEELVTADCRYVVFPDGGWDWPLWKWKGGMITDGHLVYGKFFAGKAGFISRRWWPDFANYRRSVSPAPAEGSIEEAILLTLAESGSMITRELRAACGFSGPKMRSRFDSYVTKLQMATRIVTEDFVYPVDKHNREYGWGWSLLTTPEQLYGYQHSASDRTPGESLELIKEKISSAWPQATDRQIMKMLK